MSLKINGLEDLHRHKMEAKHQLELEKLKFENAKLHLKQRFSPEQIRQDIYEASVAYIQNKFIGTFSKRISGLFDRKK